MAAVASPRLTAPSRAPHYPTLACAECVHGERYRRANSWPAFRRHQEESQTRTRDIVASEESTGMRDGGKVPHTAVFADCRSYYGSEAVLN